jgi:hypothetical protein
MATPEYEDHIGRMEFESRSGAIYVTIARLETKLDALNENINQMKIGGLKYTVSIIIGFISGTGIAVLSSYLLTHYK